MYARNINSYWNSKLQLQSEHFPQELLQLWRINSKNKKMDAIILMKCNHFDDKGSHVWMLF